MRVWEMWQVIILKRSCFQRAMKMKTKTRVREERLTRGITPKVIDIDRQHCKQQKTTKVLQKKLGFLCRSKLQVHKTLWVITVDKFNNILLHQQGQYPCSFMTSYISRKHPLLQLRFQLLFNYKQSRKLQIQLQFIFYNQDIFLQLLTTNVKKYKSRVKLQLKVYAMCQHHNNSHYLPIQLKIVLLIQSKDVVNYIRLMDLQTKHDMSQKYYYNFNQVVTM